MTFSFDPFSIIRGNAIEVLKQLQNKVDCVITSPAYYQQRIYGTSSCEMGKEHSVAEYIGNLAIASRYIQGDSAEPVGQRLGQPRGQARQEWRASQHPPTLLYRNV